MTAGKQAASQLRFSKAFEAYTRGRKEPVRYISQEIPVRQEGYERFL